MDLAYFLRNDFTERVFFLRHSANIRQIKGERLDEEAVNSSRDLCSRALTRKIDSFFYLPTRAFKIKE